MPKKLLRNASQVNDLIEIPDTAYERIRRILRSLAGFQLTSYKDAYIKRRLALRIRTAGCATADEYADLLLREGSEPVELVRTLTIHVSKFFRNPATFIKLRDEILPQLFALCLAEGRNSLNVRSIGCASGEEPYTLAMILRETFADELSRVPVSIRASDIDADMLRQASQAAYAAQRLDETPPLFRKRYFRHRGDTYHLLPEIRDMVEFHREDLIRPGPAPECDLVLCRNVLIYFERSYQESVLREFADSLRREGILVLGKTETLMGGLRKIFRSVCPEERIYQKI